MQTIEGRTDVDTDFSMTIYNNSGIIQFSRYKMKLFAGPIGRAIMTKSGDEACFLVRIIAYFPEEVNDILTVRFYSL